MIYNYQLKEDRDKLKDGNSYYVFYLSFYGTNIDCPSKIMEVTFHKSDTGSGPYLTKKGDTCRFYYDPASVILSDDKDEIIDEADKRLDAAVKYLREKFEKTVSKIKKYKK